MKLYKARNDGAKICKEIHEFSQREESAEKYFMESTCHSSKEVGGTHISGVRNSGIRFMVFSVYTVQGYSCTYLKIHRCAKKYCKGNLNVSLPVYFLYFSEHI